MDQSDDPATNEVLQENHYYPFGMAMDGQWIGDPGRENKYRFNGKELNEDFGLGWYDYGARWYDQAIGRWNAVDPLAEKYASITPYAYVANNPISLFDPNGMEIKGRTKEDAEKFHDNINEVLVDDAFEAIRGLISRSGKKGDGKKFNKIDASELQAALESSNLNEDQAALVNEIVGAINSDDKHVVEYVDIEGEVSSSGTSAFKKHLANTEGQAIADQMVPGNTMTGTLMNALSGGAINIPTRGGSYSVIVEGDAVEHYGGNQATSAMHEVIGHGPASANEIFGHANNTRAIRVDNLFRRVMGINQFRTEHGGRQIPYPYALPKKIKQ